MGLEQKIVHIPRQAAYDFMMGNTGLYVDEEGRGWYIRQIVPYEGGMTLLVERRVGILEWLGVRYS